MKRIFKSFISIVCVAMFAINLLGCESSARVASEGISATKFQSELARDYKKIFDKEFIQNHLNGLTTAELISGFVEKIKDSDDEKAKDLVSKYGMFLDQKYFVNDLSTYNWLATITTQSIKNSLNDGTFPMELVDQANAVLPLFGLGTISIDQDKKNYTDREAEEIALKFYPLIDRIADPDILRELGIDLDDPATLERFADAMTSSGKNNKETEQAEQEQAEQKQ